MFNNVVAQASDFILKKGVEGKKLLLQIVLRTVNRR